MSKIAAKKTSRTTAKGKAPATPKSEAQVDKRLEQADDQPIRNEAAESAPSPAVSEAPVQLLPTSSIIENVADRTSDTGTATAPVAAADSTGLSLSSNWLLGAAALGGIVAAAAGGGGGGGSSSSGSAPSGSASGGILAGPVLAGNDLIVKLYKADGTTPIGTATVDATGHYKANIGNYTGVVIAVVSSTGVHPDYRDEATNRDVDLGNTVLTAVGIADATGLTLSINPLTTIAAQVAGVGVDGSVGTALTTAAVQNANTAVSQAFGITGSLIAPATLTAVINQDGTRNTEADAYGKVLAVLSGLDEINGGDLQVAIHRLATDLAANDGQLSATSKFSLVVAAQDSELQSVATGLDTLAPSLALSVQDIQQVIAAGPAQFSSEALASGLSSVLGTPITAQNVTGIIYSLQTAIESGSDNLTDLAQAAQRYVSASFQDTSGDGTLNVAEALAGGLTLSIHGLPIQAGDAVTLLIADADGNSLGEMQLTVDGDGSTVAMTYDDLSTLLDGLAGKFTVHVATGLAEQPLYTTFEADFALPVALGNVSDALAVTPTAPNGELFTNRPLTITAPDAWNTADHWQYRIGQNGEWQDGPDFDGNGKALLPLVDGTYGTTADNKIYLRGIDDAGNQSNAETNAHWTFAVDTAAPVFSVAQNGQVTLNEGGAVVLINDAVLAPADAADSLVSVVTSAVGSHNAVFESSAQGGSLGALSQAGLEYGHYHYYALDYAGNVRTGEAITIDSRMPEIADGIAEQTIYANQNFSLTISDTAFNDPDGHPLSYTATLADGSALPDWVRFDAESMTFSATAEAIAANMQTGDSLSFSVTATDNAGLTAKHVTGDFALTLSAANLTLDFGDTLSIAKAKDQAVTMTLAGAAEGEMVHVRFDDNYGDAYETDLTVGANGLLTLEANALWFNIWGEGSGDTATVAVTSDSGLNLSKTFSLDLVAPEAFSSSDLSINSGPFYGYTHSDITVNAPRNAIPADHWQYRIGQNGPWQNGPAFDAHAQASLTLPEGEYGSTTENSIYLRMIDEAGNLSTEKLVNIAFTVDTHAPELSVAPDGKITINEAGAVVLIKDTLLDQYNGDVMLAADNSYGTRQVVYTNTSEAGTLNALSTSGLNYGAYHYYAVDYAGNVTPGERVSIDTQVPVINDSASIQDQTIYRTQDLNLNFDGGSLFQDPDGNPLRYSATQADGSALPEWLHFDADTMNFSAAAADVAGLTAPLAIRVIATNAAGVTEKSAYDEFTLTYVDEVLNTPPDLYLSQQWRVNVGADAWGAMQHLDLTDSSWDAEDGPNGSLADMTFTATLDGELLPAWLFMTQDPDNGYISLKAVPPAGCIGNYQLSVTVTDTLGGQTTKTLDLTVNDDGSVFYPGHDLTSFALSMQGGSQAGSWEGTAATADSTYDLNSYGNDIYFGGPSLTNNASITLLGGDDGTLTPNDPSLKLGNFRNIDIDVTGTTTDLSYLGTWRIASPENYDASGQMIAIHAGADLNVESMDTPDAAASKLTIDGNSNVAIYGLDGAWTLPDGTSPTLTVNAEALGGMLEAGIYGDHLEVTGSAQNDRLSWLACSGYVPAEASFTGGMGNDVFAIGGYTDSVQGENSRISGIGVNREITNAHLTVTDFSYDADKGYDYLVLWMTNSSQVATTNTALVLNTENAFVDGNNVLGYQAESGFEIYVDANANGTYDNSDVRVTLSNFQLGTTEIASILATNTTTIV